MSTLEQAVDQAAETARDAETEAAHGGEGKPEEGFVYDAKSWHSDCAEFLVSESVDTNDQLREELRSALRNMDFITQKGSSDSLRLMATKSMAGAASRIGFLVISNAIASGLTLENVGEYSDAKL